MSNLTSEKIAPMGGLAVMAWRLACQRGYNDPDALSTFHMHRKRPSPKDLAAMLACNSANGHYFQLIDCVTYGHEWRAEKEFNCCARCRMVKANRDFKPGEFHRGR